MKAKHGPIRDPIEAGDRNRSRVLGSKVQRLKEIQMVMIEGLFHMSAVVQNPKGVTACIS